MSDERKKAKNVATLENAFGSADHSPRSRSGRNSETIRRVNPLGFRVLVTIVQVDNVSDGGLYLPEGSKEAMQESLLAKVLDVARATDHDTHEEANVSGIPQGALVLIPKTAGVQVPWDATLRIVDSKDVLAIVNEICVI